MWEYPNEPAGGGFERPISLTTEEVAAPPVPPIPGPVSFAAAGKHIFTHIEWRMKAYTVKAEGEELPPGWVWADKRELGERYPVPSAFQAFSHIVEENL